MMSDKILPFIFSPVSSFENPCLKILIDGMMNTSNDKIVITDGNFSVLLSNFSYLVIGDNAAKKLKLSNILSGEENTRSINIDRQKVHFEVTAKKFVEDELNCEMYVIILKEITKEKIFESKFLRLTNFLKHELSTPLISQVLALKLVLKSQKNLFMLPEILYSSETSYRILKNCLEEINFDENELTVSKKELQLKPFIEKILDDCKDFLNAKHTTIETNSIRQSKIHADAKLLKKSIENILFQINERCQENSKIILKAELTHKKLRFEILAPFEFEYKDIFNHREKERLYTKLAHNNGLIVAKKIITAHGGRILTQKRCNRTSLKIILPK